MKKEGQSVLFLLLLSFLFHSLIQGVPTTDSSPYASPSAVARKPDQLDLFLPGYDGRVYTSWWSLGSSWSGTGNNWTSVGGIFPNWAPVSAVARTPDILDLFITGNDGRVYSSAWSEGNAWSGVNDNWWSLGGFFPPGAPVAAVARTPDNLDLFITGNDGRVYTSWWSFGNPWSGVNDNWVSLGGFFPPGAPISAVARTPNNLDLFITGWDGRVYTSWWSLGNPWSGVNNNWFPLGGFFPVGAPVSAVARTGNNLDLFITGNDGRVYTSWWSFGNAWSGVNNNWTSLGGFFPVAAPVATVARTENNLDLFITGNDGRVYSSAWSLGNAWSGVNDNWWSLGGFFPPGSAVAAVARRPLVLDLFIKGSDGKVYSSAWSDGNAWSGINNNWWDLGGFFPRGYIRPPRLQFRLRYFAEADSTDNFLQGANDEVYLAALGTDSAGVVVGPGGVPEPEILRSATIGDVSDDSVREAWRTQPYVLMEFDLSRFGDWPRSYTVTLLIVEEDNMNLAEAFRELESRVGARVRDAVVAAASTAAGSLAGAAIGSVIPGIGTAVGAAVGALVGVAFNAIVDAVRNGLGNDIFTPVPLTVVIPNPVRMRQQPEFDTPLFLTIEQYGARYVLEYEWHLV